MSGQNSSKKRRRKSNNNQAQQLVPKGWTMCPREPRGIIGNLFVAMKTPLDYKFNNKVPLLNRFKVRSFFTSMSMKNVSIGLWIDLTNTARYYDKYKVFDMGCTYVKIPCAGHLTPPTQGQTNSFINVCLRFAEENPFQYIAVHCTHGYNRTGFMIASYLIEVLGYDVYSALAEFAAARPPGIYKQNKIDELYRRYSYEQPILAPRLPYWTVS